MTTYNKISPALSSNQKIEFKDDCINDCNPKSEKTQHNSHIRIIWENNLKILLKNISESLDHGENTSSFSDLDFYTREANVVNGWKCLKCGEAHIDASQIENFIAKKYLRIIITELLENSTLEEVPEIDQIIGSGIVVKARKRISNTIAKSRLSILPGKHWLWMCPDCNCRDISAFKWEINKEEDSLTESGDNLRTLRPAFKKRMISLSKLLTFW